MDAIPLIRARYLQAFAAAAEAAGMSVRSLQRRLASEGLTFSQLIDEVRFEMAVPQLRDPDIRLTDIALSLGYSDPAHFTRAFGRWGGVSPSEYRAHQLVS
jgi:AraC-like DNA-binding protein